MAKSVVRLWPDSSDLILGRVPQLVAWSRCIGSVRWSLASGLLASGSDDCLVCLWDIAAPLLEGKRDLLHKVLLKICGSA